MKIINFLILLTFVSLVKAQAQTPEIDCKLVKCSTQIVDPVCCNGDFYPNTCLARCVGGFSNVDAQCTPGQCLSPPLELPFCKNQVFCLVDPCEFDECPSYPDAVCLSNYCEDPFYFFGTLISGACTSVWVDPFALSVIPQDQCEA